MTNITTINLGLGEERLEEFLEGLKGVVPYDANFHTMHYKELDPTKAAEISDILILSPGSALVGLPDHNRAERDPYVALTQLFIQNAVNDGIPMLGVNVGHQMLNTAYGLAIDKLPDDYEREVMVWAHDRIHTFQDRIVDTIYTKLTNNYGVLPRKNQKHRYGQHKLRSLLDHEGFVLISKADVESPMPIYGFQFNLEKGTEPLFRNFFELAGEYLR